MPKGFAVALAWLALALFAPKAQAQYGQPYYPQDHFEVGVARLRNRFDRIFASGSDSICRRELAQNGWSRVAQSRCPQVGIYPDSNGGASYSYSGYDNNYRSYRGDYRQPDYRSNNGWGIGSAVLGAVNAGLNYEELRKLNEINRRLEDQQRRTQASRGYDRDENRGRPQQVGSPENWVNQTGCPLRVKDAGDRDWTVVPPAGVVRVKDAETAEMQVESSTCQLTSNQLQPGLWAIGCK
jgi:hypothetical protein